MSSISMTADSDVLVLIESGTRRAWTCSSFGGGDCESVRPRETVRR